MATACANSTIINSNNNEYNLYYANCRRLNLQSGFVQNLKNKFMAIIESEKTSQVFEEKNIRKYKSLENIEDNCYSTILAHHKSLESINDSINFDENSIGLEKNVDEKHFDFATIQSKFGKPTESVRKRHTTKINPYNYQQSYEKSGDSKLLKNNDEKESKVQQIKNMFSKKLKHANLTNYENNNVNFKTNIIGELESHCTMNGKPYSNDQINIVEKTASFGGKSFVKSSSGIYFYYNKQDTEFFRSDEAPVDEVLGRNDSSNHLSKKLNKDSKKPKMIGIATGEVQKTKIEDLHNKGLIHNGTRNSICNDLLMKSNIHNDPEGYWRVTRDLVHKIRAKGRSYRFENGKKQELPTTIFLPMLKTNFGNENKSHNLITSIKNKDKNNCFFYPNFNANHDSILNFNNSINVNKKTAYSIVTPLYKESYSIQNGPNTLSSSSKPCRNIINHIDTMDTKRIKTHFKDNISLNHETSNELANSLECSTNDYDEDFTEEHYKNLSKQIVVFGAYIKLEKNCFLQSDRKKFHRIKFDTAEPLTYEYPSEQSLIEQELENEDVKTRINAFKIKAAAAAEAIICKESKTSLRCNQKNNFIFNPPMEHNHKRFEDDKISPNVTKIDTRSTPSLALYPNDAEIAGDKNLYLLSANDSQSQPKSLNDTETILSTFRPKNLKNSIKILSFNETVKSDDIECTDVALGCVQDESTTLLHTYPIPADDLVTSKWSITTTHYSDLLF